MPETLGTAYDTARTAIEARVRSVWAMDDGQLLTPVLFGDARKLESSAGEMDKEPDRMPWLRVDIVWGDAFTDSIGPGAQNRCTGFVQVALYYPKVFPSAPGAAGVLQLSDKVRAIFANYFGSGLEFEASSGPVVADENQWKVRIITTNFQFYECAAAA